jgi:hypothetical protein
VRAARLRRRRYLSPSSVCGWTRAVRFWLVLLTCLAQFAQHWHAPAFAAHSMAYATAAAGSGVRLANVDAGQLGVPCAVHGARANPNDGGNGGAPCPCRDCPFCPCPCCAPLHAAIGILPQEMSRAAYALPFAKVAPPPVRLGAAIRFAVVSGQPRAPPILI